MNNALSKTDAATAFQGLITLGRDFSGQVAEAIQQNDTVARTMAVSFGMAALLDHVAENAACVNVICRQAGTKWGFKTDRDNRDGGGTQYPVATIIETACEAMLRGLMLVGNEFNIITGQQYTTQEGWRGLLERKPGVSQIDAQIGTVQNIACREVKTKNGATMQKITALISARASCLLNGQLIEVAATEMPDMDGRLQLKAFVADVDESIDQLKGKALARIYERLYCKCFGVSEGSLGTPEVGEANEPAEVVAEPVRAPAPVKQATAVVVEEEPREPKTSDPSDWNGEWAAFGQRFGKGHTTLIFARRMASAKSPEALAAIGTEVEQLKPQDMGQRDLDRLRLYRGHLAGLLAQQPEAVLA